jgi:hypothetical protein
MTNKTYKFENNQLVLQVKKAPIVLRVFLATFSLVSALSVLYGIYLIFSVNRPSLVILLLPAIWILSGIFFFRLLLWNSYGKEILTFAPNNVSYIADYKWFKDGKQEINDHLGLHINIIPSKTNKGKSGQIEFSSMGESILCVTNLPIDSCNEIKDLLDENKYIHG